MTSQNLQALRNIVYNTNCPKWIGHGRVDALGVGKKRANNVGGANKVLGLHEGGVVATYKSVA